MIERWEYEEEVERIAREALETERQYGQEASEAAWESVDGHSWIIYSANAALIPNLSSSGGAVLLDCQDLDAIYRKEGLGSLQTKIAFACMLEDVLGKIEELRSAEDEDEEEAEDAEE